MFGFLGSADKRIVLINFEGLSVYSLHRDLLVHVTKFSDERAGYETFRRYLSDEAPTPVSVLVDSVAEDFMVKTVPHVSFYDRNSFLQRKSEQFFRGTEYRSAQVIGREEGGRRDDRVLFSAITKNQTLDPWINALLQEEVPIKSITTTAYALCKLAAEFSLLSSDTVLLVNWELSGIRQSLVVDGIMMFSRVTPLPYDEGENLAAAILESCTQSKEYLERIGLLNYDQPLDVHILTPHLDDEAFADQAQSRNFSVVMHHNSIDLMQVGRYSGSQASITALLLCLDWGVRSNKIQNTYAPPKARRFYYLRQVKKFITASAVAIALLSGLVSAPLVLDGLNRNVRATRLAQDVLPVQAQYDALRSQFPVTPIPSEAMELAVQTYDTIRSQVNSPITLLAAISRVLVDFPAIELSSLDWSLSGVQFSDPLTSVLLDNRSEVNLDIYGILIGSSSIQDSDIALHRLIDALNQIDGVFVSPISLPIESGPYFEVNTVVDDDFVDTEFALNVKLES